MHLVSHLLATPRHVAWFLLLTSSSPLIAALISQYVFNMAPCVLCIYQRVPYIIVIALSSLVLLKPSLVKHLTIVLYISIIAYLANVGIAFFHVGVESGWWQGTSACGGTINATTIEELQAQLNAAPEASCSQPPFVFLGLSMAGWNVIYCFLLAGLLYFIEKQRKNVT